MSNKFNLGDGVAHATSKSVGRVVGLRVAEPYTVQVRWEGVARIEKDWYRPEVLEPHALTPVGLTDEELGVAIVDAIDGLDWSQLEFGETPSDEEFVAAILPIIKTQKEASYEEGYAFCQDTNGMDGPSS